MGTPAGAEPFEVTSADGHRFGGQLHRSTGTGAVLLFMPAMGTRARYYARFAAALAAAGVTTALFDWRGIETSSLRASRAVNFGYRHLLEDDLPAAVRAVRARVPDGPLWIGGHSLGGQLGACYAAAHADQVAGIVMIAAGTVDYRAWPGLWKYGLLAFTQATIAIGTVLGYYPGPRFRFGGIEARGVMRDWARVARSGRYGARGSAVDYERALAGFTKPVLSLGFSGDTLAPAKAAAGLLAKLCAAQKTQWRWAAADTGGTAFDHFSWAKRPELVAPRVAGWLLER